MTDLDDARIIPLCFTFGIFKSIKNNLCKMIELLMIIL